MDYSTSRKNLPNTIISPTRDNETKEGKALGQGQTGQGAELAWALDGPALISALR